MDTLVLSSQEIDRAAELLLQGEIVAFPTETVYGLGASLFDEEAVLKIFKAKGRPSDNPLIAHVSSLDQILSITESLPSDFYTLYDAFFPGPLTLVLPKKQSVTTLASGGLQTIAVRMPKHPIASALISRVGVPLVAPSANLSGRPSSTHFKHVLSDFDGKIAAVIKDTESELGLESTVVSLLGSRPVLLRPGHITQEDIESVLKKQIALYEKKEGSPVLSPGMKYRHYAPQGDVKLFYSEEDLATYLAKAPIVRRMVVSSYPDKSYTNVCEFFPLSSKTIYSVLRRADERGYEEVLVLCSLEAVSNHALMNRLSRAAEANLQEGSTCEQSS